MPTKKRSTFKRIVVSESQAKKEALARAEASRPKTGKISFKNAPREYSNRPLTGEINFGRQSKDTSKNNYKSTEMLIRKDSTIYKEIPKTSKSKGFITKKKTK